jgi:hypothetical protein
MILRHYSNTEITEVRSHESEQKMGQKPQGFWISVDDNGEGWADWCRDNDYRVEHLTHIHNVELHSDAYIILINNEKEIDTFHNAHKVTWAGPYDWIDWKSVAKKYQGIIIAPYLWSRRMDADCIWYYGWDCASGCIWDASAIASISLEKVEA